MGRPRGKPKTETKPWKQTVERRDNFKRRAEEFGFRLNEYNKMSNSDVIWWVQELVRRWLFLNLDASSTFSPDQLYEVQRIVSKPVERGQPYAKQSVVRQVTLLDISRLHRLLLPPLTTYSGDPDIEKEAERLKLTVLDAEKARGASPTSCIIEFNLLAGDDVVAQDLKRLAAEARKASGIAARRKGQEDNAGSYNSISEADLQRWKTGNLLPYIDLLLICKALGLNIPDDVSYADIGAMLYPGSPDLVKTPRGLLEEVMNLKFLRFLTSQGAQAR